MSTEWHVAENGVRRGPFSEQDLRSMIAAGQCGMQTRVWRDGLEDWVPLASVPELCAGHPWLAAQAAGHGAPTNGLAITSMVCGILGVMITLFMCGAVSGVAAVPAVICGHMALSAISRSPVPLAGRGMAITGLVTGYLGLLAQLGVIGFFLFAFLSAAGSGVGP